MSAKDDTLKQLNAVRSQLTAFIIASTATPGTPQWKALERVVEQNNEVSGQINDIIQSVFKDVPGLGDAVTTLQAATQKLTDVKKVLDNIGTIITVVDQVIQAATAILTLVG